METWQSMNILSDYTEIEIRKHNRSRGGCDNKSHGMATTYSRGPK